VCFLALSDSEISWTSNKSPHLLFNLLRHKAKECTESKMYRFVFVMLIVFCAVVLADQRANIDMNIEPTLRQKRGAGGTIWAAVINNCWRLTQTFTGYYGCWCGSHDGIGHICNGVKDNVDWCCMWHDKCYDAGYNERYCDNWFSNCLDKYC